MCLRNREQALNMIKFPDNVFVLEWFYELSPLAIMLLFSALFVSTELLRRRKMSRCAMSRRTLPCFNR